MSWVFVSEKFMHNFSLLTKKKKTFIFFLVRDALLLFVCVCMSVFCLSICMSVYMAVCQERECLNPLPHNDAI